MPQLPEINHASGSSMMGYDPATEKMYVRFENGSVYEYSGVKQAEYDSLAAGPPMRTVARKLSYPYRKL